MNTNDTGAIDDNHEEIAELLQEISDVLKDIDDEPSDELSMLHDNLEKVSECVQDEGVADLRYLDFFFNNFIKELWDNIAMTSSKKIDDDYIIDMLRAIAPYFENISDHIRTKEYDKCYQEYVGIVEVYFTKINSVGFQEIQQEP
jgi:hypothetical protein